jgi:hypothetical protein
MIMESLAYSPKRASEGVSVGVDDTRLFLKQFLIGPEVVAGLQGWKTVFVREDIVVTHHPDLNVVQVRGVQASLTLLGYLLDPLNPHADDETILQGLLAQCVSFEELRAATDKCGGRWVLIATHAERTRLFTDALGLRQAFFTPQLHRKGVWVCSQPGLLAECLGFEIDAAGRAFVDSYTFRSNAEYRWPAAATLYREVRHLLPNHWLDLSTGRSFRYWPREPLLPVEPDVAADRLARLLPRMVEAAASRFDLALGITAGWDSRLVLAASRAVSDRLAYVTVRQNSMPDTAADLVVPARLLARLGLSHTVITAFPVMSAEFSYRFKRSVCLAHDHYGGDAEALLTWSQRRKVAMTGSGAEVGRCSFRSQLPDADRRSITAADLAHLQRMAIEKFAIHEFQLWLTGAADRRGVKLLDLFEWEQGHGNWLAMTQLEFDSAWQDIFTPYNCRDVLVTLLSVDERYRKKPDYLLYRTAIARLWPDVLVEPINPKTPANLATRVGRRLRRLRNIRRRLTTPPIFRPLPSDRC